MGRSLALMTKSFIPLACFLLVFVGCSNEAGIAPKAPPGTPDVQPQGTSGAGAPSAPTGKMPN